MLLSFQPSGHGHGLGESAPRSPRGAQSLAAVPPEERLRMLLRARAGAPVPARTGANEYARRTGAKVVRPFDRRIAIRTGDLGTADTIREMARLAVKGSRDIPVRLMALEIIKGVPGRDHAAVARRIFHWMQDKGSGERSGVKFVNDPHRTETIQEPWITLFVTGAGDCNSAHSTTMAALLMSVGVPAFFRTVRVDPGRPHLFSHVYAVANVRGKALAMDTSVPFSTPGSEPETVYGTRDWPIDVFDEDDFSGKGR